MVEARQAEQVAQHAQHLPGRARLAQRLDDAVEALHPAFGVDEGAGGFGERGDRQQHVGDVGRRVLEGRQRHHQARAGQRRARPRRRRRASSTGSTFSSSSAFIGWLSIWPAFRPPAPGSAPTSCAPTLLRGFAEVADAGAGVLADPLRQRQQLRGLRVLRGGVAQQHGLALAGQQRLRRWPVRAAPGSAGSGAATPCAAATAAATSASGCSPGRSARRSGVAATGISPVVVHACRLVQLRAACAPPGAGAARTADGPCAGRSR